MLIATKTILTTRSKHLLKINSPTLKKDSNASSHNFQATRASLRLANSKKSNLHNPQNFMIKPLNKLPKSPKTLKSLALIALVPILRKINYV